MLRCKARAFPVGTGYAYISRPFFTPRKMRMRMNLDHAASGRFVLGETLISNSQMPAVSMPPTKVCPLCKTAVPVDRRHVNTVIMSFDPNKNDETYESSEIS